MSTLVSCTLADNWADYYGGGAFYGSITNCISVFKIAKVGENHRNSMVHYSCTTPLPPGGVGNFAMDPMFVDYAVGNLRLQSNSPCINAGLNAFVFGATDLDGNPRSLSGTVDIGAFEFQGAGSIISYAWLQRYGLPTGGSADFAHGDADGMNNWQEWRCGTCPTNPLSALRLLSPSRVGTNVVVSWQSVAGVNYFLERCTNLASLVFTPLATDIPGQPGTTSFTDTNTTGAGPFFYRVGVGQ